MTKYEWALLLTAMPVPFIAGYLVGILRERWAWRGVDKKVNDWFEHLHADDPPVDGSVAGPSDSDWFARHGWKQG